MKRTLLAVALLLLAACGGNSTKKTGNTTATQTALPDAHTAETSLDYAGTYTGTVPAADCPGIEMRLTLRGDGAYDLHEKYIDRNAEFDEKGSYTVEGNLLTLDSGKDSDVRYFKVEENRLRMLTQDKQPVTGALADNYILLKTE